MDLMLKLLSIAFFTTLINEQTFSQVIKESDTVSVQKNTIEVDGKIFEKVESEAEFPGGQNAWIAYLQNNLKADVPVRKKAPAGKYQVIVRFIVSKDGKIRDIKAETNHGYGMEKEVIRIINKGPKWVPAQQNGLPVNAYRRQLITFEVTEE
jgi:protein TonB